MSLVTRDSEHLLLKRLLVLMNDLLILMILCLTSLPSLIVGSWQGALVAAE